jgi:uncharacterized iron-regulated membrane protein
MSFRSCLFWAHLGSGVLAGLVILMMSVTGVLLTYERQLIAWSDRAALPGIEIREERASVQALLASATKHAGTASPSALTFARAPGQAVSVALGRAGVLYLDPYTAELLGKGNQGSRAFFGFVTRLHRWFALEGASRDTARAITGASNLLFAFIVMSGMYLWLPRFYRWTQLRMRLLFRRDNRTSKERDFNWHHVCGFWCCLPLLLVILSATVFSYPWASNLVYRVWGEEPPVRGGPPRADTGSTEFTGQPSARSLDRMLALAMAQDASWNTLSLRLPAGQGDEVSFLLDRGDGGQPQLQSTLVLEAATGAVTRHEVFSDLSPGRRTRSIIRRLHTGEVFGLPGQTVAGLASLAAVVLVWTGLALAWRRLVQPLLRSGRIQPSTQ